MLNNIIFNNITHYFIKNNFILTNYLNFKLMNYVLLNCNVFAIYICEKWLLEYNYKTIYSNLTNLSAVIFIIFIQLMLIFVFI